MNVELLLEYDGTSYHGWQRQKNARSVQQVLEEAINAITGENVRVIGAGRTDAGVHALGQVANFKTNTRIPLEKLPYAINNRLPDDIVVKRARAVPEDFHARLWAKAKVYAYTIHNASFPSPLIRNFAYFFPITLDVDAMKRAGSYFLGVHDFSAFMASGSAVKSCVRHIFRLEVNRQGDLIKIEVEANGFLYNMVRIISGTLLDVGLHRICPEEVASIIESGNRDMAGRTLPPQGLCLLKVVY
ncbi:MAG: tRNA pseudouridine(38-40) synthase TruA [Tepidanaerobacteraceae bacterium]|nr:tRNA pseudouridine(38-40) synthase TruA [Tepidanaerobacteraceae bacterium]